MPRCPTTRPTTLARTAVGLDPFHTLPRCLCDCGRSVISFRTALHSHSTTASVACLLSEFSLTWNSSYAHPWPILQPSLGHLAPIPGSSRNQPPPILRPSYAHPPPIPHPSCAHATTILGPSWSHLPTARSLNALWMRTVFDALWKPQRGCPTDAPQASAAHPWSIQQSKISSMPHGCALDAQHEPSE